MLPHPRVIGRALHGKVERDLESQPARRSHEMIEVGQGAQFGMDGVVAALVAAYRPG